MTTTETDKTRHSLSIEQANAVDLLLQGQTDQAVADQVGVTRQTVTTWRNGHAGFIAELNRRRQEVWGGQTERLRGLVARAVDILAEDLEAEDPRLRQGAAIHVLKSVGLYGANLKPTGQTDPEAIEAEQNSVSALLAKLAC